MQYLESVVQIASVLLLIFSMVFLSGIIWRVEMKLDITYKLFFGSIFFLFVSYLEKMIAYEAFWLDLAGLVSQLLFAVLFFWGVMEMRSLLRDVDGERGNFINKEGE